MGKLDVVGLGFSCIDDLLLLSEIPPPEGRATVRRREQHGGGMAATAMVAVARLGGRAGFVAKVGDDPVGRRMLEEFREYGVDVSRAVVQPGATSHLTVVLVAQASGARAFLSQRGTVGELRPEEVDQAYVTTAAALHLADAGAAAVQTAHWAKAAGREVCFDGTHFHPSFLQLVPYLTYAVVSRFFASEFVAHQDGRDVGRAARDFAALASPHPPFGPACASGWAAPSSFQRYVRLQQATPSPLVGEGEQTLPSPPVHHPSGSHVELAGEQLLGAAERLRQLGPPVVVVTDGERGCWCAAPGECFHVPAYPVQPVDTTGAGDVFHGAFLLGRVRGWSLRQSLALASAAAGLKCRALGGRAGIPTMEEALALMDASPSSG